MRLDELFGSEDSTAIRMKLASGVLRRPEPPYIRANYAVVNPIDYCPVGCAHCMFSSKARPEAMDIALRTNHLHSLSGVLRGADVRELVLTGGGEPFENLPAMLHLIEEVPSLEHVVVINSAYFAQDTGATRETLDSLLSACREKRVSRGWKPVELTMRISRDDSYMKAVPLDNIARVVSYLDNHPGSFHLIIRTLMADEGGEDIQLAQLVGGRLAPSLEVDPPSIDGLHTRWIKREGTTDIAVLYKPAYFTGRGRLSRNERRRGSGASVWEIAEAELKAGTPLNLAIRGPRGEGHDYYQTLLRGESHWRECLGGGDYVTPKDPAAKQLALFVSASGDISINSGVPDLHFSVNHLTSWDEFLSLSFFEPLQHFLVSRGPFAALQIAEEVEPSVRERVADTGFVFSISLYSLETPALRLYVALRAMQELLAAGEIEVSDEFTALLAEPASALRQAYANRPSEEQAATRDIRTFDPIRGGAPSAWRHIKAARISPT